MTWGWGRAFRNGGESKVWVTRTDWLSINEWQVKKMSLNFFICKMEIIIPIVTRADSGSRLGQMVPQGPVCVMSESILCLTLSAKWCLVVRGWEKELSCGGQAAQRGKDINTNICTHTHTHTYIYTYIYIHIFRWANTLRQTMIPALKELTG